MEFKDSELALILKGLSMVSAVASDPIGYLVAEIEERHVERIEGVEAVLKEIEKCIEIEKLVLRFAEKIEDPVFRYGILAETHRNIEITKEWQKALKNFEVKSERQKAECN